MKIYKHFKCHSNMFWEVVLSIVLVFAVYYCVKQIQILQRCYSLLFKLPQPKWTPFLGHLPELLCADTVLFNKLRQFSRELGPIFFTTIFYVVSIHISSADGFEAITSPMKNLQKAKIYRYFHKWLGSGLLTSTGSQWQIRRKILSPAFHFTILKDFIHVFNEQTDTLVELLKENEGKSLNVIPLISQCTLGAIVETAMGSKLDLQKESDNSYVQAIHKLGKIVIYKCIRAPWTVIVPFTYWIHPRGLQEIALVNTINNFTNRVIKNREQNFEKNEDLPSSESNEEYIYYGKKKLAMLDLLLNAKLTNGIIDDEGIKDEVNTIMFEGHDTTSMAISFILMLLANHRKEQDLVYEEIIQNSQNDQKHFDWNGLNDLKYTEQVIKEGLRLYPSVPSIGRVTDEEVPSSNGFIIPKECDIYMHIFDLHRNPKYWQEPEKFDPDRFLPENSIDRHPFAYVPFSAGPRNCIGQRFAMLELKAVLAGIVRNFILEPVDTPESISLVPDIVLRPLNDTLLVKFTNRKK